MTLVVVAAAVAIVAVNVVRRLVRGGLEPTSVDLSGIEVATADGEPVRIGELVQRPAILVLPRYYG